MITKHTLVELPFGRKRAQGRAMSQNLGDLDRVGRIVLGIGLIALTGLGPQTFWGLLGLYPLITARLGWCPLYHLLGINSRR